jgi:hypothetical protein
MRIVYEWYEQRGRGLVRRCEVAEGETIADIDDEIRRVAGEAVVTIDGLRNTQGNFEIYTGVLPSPAPKGRFRRRLDRLRAFWQG